MHSKVKLRDFDPSRGFDRGAWIGKFILWYFIKMVFFLTAFPFPSVLKVALLRLFGAKIGNGVIIKPRVNIHFPWKLIVGSNVWIGEEVLMLNFEQITIGDDVCVSQRVFLCTGNHDYKEPSMPYRNAPILLGNGCWIGASGFISPGVKVGEDTVVFAGSVVTADLLSGSIYKGNPLIYVKERWK